MAWANSSVDSVDSFVCGEESVARLSGRQRRKLREAVERRMAEIEDPSGERKRDLELWCRARLGEDGALRELLALASRAAVDACASHGSVYADELAVYERVLELMMEESRRETEEGLALFALAGQAPGFDPSRGSIRGWLTAIARNELRSVLRLTPTGLRAAQDSSEISAMAEEPEETEDPVAARAGRFDALVESSWLLAVELAALRWKLDAEGSTGEDAGRIVVGLDASKETARDRMRAVMSRVYVGGVDVAQEAGAVGRIAELGDEWLDAAQRDDLVGAEGFARHGDTRRYVFGKGEMTYGTGIRIAAGLFNVQAAWMLDDSLTSRTIEAIVSHRDVAQAVYRGLPRDMKTKPLERLVLGEEGGDVLREMRLRPSGRYNMTGMTSFEKLERMKTALFLLAKRTKASVALMSSDEFRGGAALLRQATSGSQIIERLQGVRDAAGVQWLSAIEYNYYFDNPVRGAKRVEEILSLARDEDFEVTLAVANTAHPHRGKVLPLCRMLVRAEEAGR